MADIDWNTIDSILADDPYDDIVSVMIGCANETSKIAPPAHRPAYSDKPLYHRAQQKAYRQRHPDKVKVRFANRRARLLNQGADLTPEQWQATLDHFSGCCAVCGSPAGFWNVIAQDHWIPVSKGGGTTVKNVIPLCHAKVGVPIGEPCCNNSKSDTLPQEWLIQKYGKQKGLKLYNRIQSYLDSL